MATYNFLVMVAARTAAEKQIRWVFDDDLGIIFHIHHKNICCGYSLVSPRGGDSNEYQQRMLLWGPKETFPSVIIKFPMLSVSLPLTYIEDIADRAAIPEDSVDEDSAVRHEDEVCHRSDTCRSWLDEISYRVLEMTKLTYLLWYQNDFM